MRPGIGAAMQEMVARNEIAGAVTVIVAKDKLLHLESSGLADVTAKRPMTPETLFWIASMTKPITGTAILMLPDEGKLNVARPQTCHLFSPQGPAAACPGHHHLGPVRRCLGRSRGE